MQIGKTADSKGMIVLDTTVCHQESQSHAIVTRMRQIARLLSTDDSFSMGFLKCDPSQAEFHQEDQGRTAEYHGQEVYRGCDLLFDISRVWVMNIFENGDTLYNEDGILVGTALMVQILMKLDSTTIGWAFSADLSVYNALTIACSRSARI